MAQPNPPNPGKMEQLKNTGKKAADQMKNIAGEAGENYCFHNCSNREVSD